MLNFKIILFTLSVFVTLSQSRFYPIKHYEIPDEPLIDNDYSLDDLKYIKKEPVRQYTEGLTYTELEILANVLFELDAEVHNAQNVVNNIQRKRLNNMYSKIHYNYYDENAPEDYYDDMRKHTHHRSRSRKRHRKKKHHYSTSDSDSGSDSDSSSSEVKPVRFEIVKHKKGPRQPPPQPPLPIADPVASDVSLEHSEEVSTFKPKKKEAGDEYDVIQGHLRKIKNKGRRAGMRLESFLPKRYRWKEEDLPKLGYLWFNGATN